MSFDLLALLREGLSDQPSITRPAGIEIRQDLIPAGGLPVQPPAYEAPLEIHPRHVDEQERLAIEIDSVGSCANRIEEALLELYRADEYPLPVSSTTVEPSHGEPITITTLEMPHRVFDAWLRLSDAADGSEGRFEDSTQGKELSFAHVGELDALLETSAHDLLLGVWDSHRKGPHGQVRIGRSLTTSLIGLDPVEQKSVAARRDPLNLGDASDKAKGGRKPETKESKKLSELGLSSIPPQRGKAGVAITEARYLGFLSFPGLRRLGFKRYDPLEARLTLAALGLYGVLLRVASGWDLRARCAFVPDGDPQFKLVGGDRKLGEQFTISLPEAEALFRDSVKRLAVRERSVHLKAGSQLDELVNKAIAAA